MRYTGSYQDLAKAGDPASHEQVEILALMKAETEAFLRRDFDAVRSFWIDTPESRFMVSWPGVGTRVSSGPDEIISTVKACGADAGMDSRAEGTVRYSNISIVVGADMAWASYDQVASTDDPNFQLAGLQRELKIFHRIGGEWKIAAVVVMARTVDHLPDPVISVGPSMEVLWINEPGRAAVASHPELLIGPARLRARNRDSDADLRAAVDWAHTLKIASPRKKLAAMARLRTVRLGETDEGAPLFCWVFIEDGEVLITFDVPEAAERRLNYARSVFSLSPAQLRLANELVAGHRLTEAARNLDVSVTTLRTQLRRMFDKTGQRTQAGLVRALLSLHVPTKV